MTQLPDKPCTVCGAMLKPIQQYAFPEVLCWTCWQDLEELRHEQQSGNTQELTQADLILILKLDREGKL